LLQSLRAAVPLDRASSTGRFLEGPLGGDGGLAILILLGFAAARVIFALTLDFGIDESYTLAVARRLSWSYFDHPPLHQWIAHFAALVLGEGPAVRLPFVALFAATGWLMFALTRQLFGSRAGLWAIFALNVTPFYFASAGGWIVPDGPLLFALSAAALGLARLFFRPEAHVWRNWLAVGLFLGLAGLSKYNAVLFAVGLLVFLTLSPSHRRWLAHPAPYCGAAVALLLIAPVLVWNADNGWVSFLFQGGRGAASGRWRPAQAMAMAIGEIALLSPWIFVPLLNAVVVSIRRIRAAAPEASARLFLLCLALPAIVVFSLTPLWGARGLPHWPMPGWLFVYPLLGAGLANTFFARGAWAIGSAAGLGLVAGLALFEARTGYAARLAPQFFTADPTLESLNWSPLREQSLLAGKDAAAFVVATKWTEAGKIAQALGPATPVLTFCEDPRGFAFLDDSAAFLHKDAVIIVARKRLTETIAALAPYFASIGDAQYVSLGRSGIDEIDLALVPARDLLRPYPLPYGRDSSTTIPEGAS
jgi:hypothetical protein